MSDAAYQKLVTAIRIIFGIHMFLSGLNWWVKITLYPSIVDFIDKAPPHNILGALVDTGFMFDIVKLTEMLGGLMMLLNRYVPLTLVLMMPVTVPVFMQDVLINTRLRGMVMGTTAMLENSFLLCAYFNHYRSMMPAQARPDPL